ncbi:MAG: SUMF1/EgtB/PvdO family nonheme iron enzyme, partial [Candidatus Coatesbacteria bacterium]|nr:SUMF1/EgtB/PvdO family nonheme iron enzyme [Candidatus Coatesbacteria bacterium]
MRFTLALCGLLAMLPAFSLGAPIVNIHTDKDFYEVGERIELSLSGANSGGDAIVDLYVGLLYEDGRTYFLSSEGWSWTWSTLSEPISPTPFIASISMPNGFATGPTPFEWLDLPCRMPTIGQAGRYFFVAALAAAGTSDWIGEMSMAPFYLETPPQRPMRMISVPAGSFDMGDGYEPPEGPLHRVNVSAFIMSEMEVTQGQWMDVMGFNPSWDRFHIDLPVEYVTWYDNVNFCNEKSISEGLTPCYTIENIVRYNSRHI